jgi:Arc/MetJ-type ribon-helix-helix transcriptional regulator
MAKKEFAPGGLITDGLVEFIEWLFKELGPTGEVLTGIRPIVEGLKLVGMDNKFMIGGMEVACKRALVFTNMSLALQTLMRDVFDAYFDKIKDLSEEANENQVQRAKGEGIKKASAKLREFLAKQTGKPSFAAMLMKLSDTERSSFHRWLRTLEIFWASALKEWNVHKERIGSIDELREVVKCGDVADMSEATNARLSYLRMAYGREQTMLETAKAFLIDGEKTPQIEKLEAKIAEVKAGAMTRTAANRAKIKAIKDQNER